MIGAIAVIAILGAYFLTSNQMRAPGGTTSTLTQTTQQAAQTITLVQAPTNAKVAIPVTVSWRIDSSVQKNIAHTAVHYSTKSIANPQSVADYQFVTDIQSGTIPNTYSAQMILVPAGTYYYRAHAIVDGQNIWSEEKMIAVGG